MESITLKKNSWHYRLATVYGNWDPLWDGEMCDICSYSRKVTYGAIRAVIVAAVLGFVAATFADFALYLQVAGGTNDFVPPHFMGVFGMILSAFTIAVSVITSIAFSLVWLVKQGIEWFMDQDIADKIADALAKCKPSFLSAWYRSYKDKVCFRINFDE